MERLTKERILEAFAALARELGQGTGRPTLYVCGGAALVLLYGARETTRDVDAFVAAGMDAGPLRAASGRVAEALGLPVDWLNDAAKGYAHGLTPGATVFETENLLIRSLAPEQLLAMKLSAWRDDLDISDARILLRSLPREREAVWKLIEPHLVPGRELKATYAFADIWGAEHEPR